MKRILTWTCRTCGRQVWFRTLRADEHPKLADEKLGCQSVECNCLRVHKRAIEEVEV